MTPIAGRVERLALEPDFEKYELDTRFQAESAYWAAMDANLPYPEDDPEYLAQIEAYYAEIEAEHKRYQTLLELSVPDHELEVNLPLYGRGRLRARDGRKTTKKQEPQDRWRNSYPARRRRTAKLFKERRRYMMLADAS